MVTVNISFRVRKDGDVYKPVRYRSKDDDPTIVERRDILDKIIGKKIVDAFSETSMGTVYILLEDGTEIYSFDSEGYTTDNGLLINGDEV